MSYKIQEILEIGQLQTFLERLNEIYSFTSAILDLDGNILVAAGWQDVCLKFHRCHPEAREACRASDSYIFSHIQEANPAVTYKCSHGIMDNAAPIIIDGVHYGNFFIGQIFHEQPDLEFFREQARHYGWDENEYLNAVKKVPIWSQEKLNEMIVFINVFIQLIASMGLKNLREKEIRNEIKEKEDRLKVSEIRYKKVIETTDEGIWMLNHERQTIYVNQRMADMLGYSPQEMFGIPFDNFIFPEDWAEQKNHFENRKIGIGATYQRRFFHKDGHVVYTQINASPLISPEGEFEGSFGMFTDISELKLTEQVLAKTQAHLTSIIDSTSDFIWSFEISNRSLLTWNKAFEKHFKEVFKVDVKVGDTIETLFTKFPDYIDFWNKTCDETILNGHCHTIYTRPTKDFILEVNANVMVQDGQAFGISVFGKNITEQKLAEYKLQKNESLLKTAVKAAGLFLYETIGEASNGTRKIYFDSNTAMLLGMELNDGEIIHKEWVNCIHPADRGRLTETFNNVHFKGLDYASEEYRYSSKTKGDIWINQVAQVVERNEKGEASHVIGVFQDITDRKSTELRILESEEKFRKLFQNSTVGKSITQKDGSLQVNSQFCKILGYSEEELNHLRWQDITHPDDIQYNIDKIIELEKNHLPNIRFEKRYIHKDGSIIWADFSTYPQRNQDGEILYYVTAITNITETKKLIKDLVEAKEKAEEMNRLKSSFLANMSHELRTPMMGILGFSDLLRENSDTIIPSEAGEIIHASGERLLETLNLILNLSLIEAGKLSIEYSNVNVIEVSEDVMNLFSVVIRKKGLSSRITSPFEFLMLDTDEKLLREILTNLINNAIKFTEHGGITVEISKDITASGEWVIIKVIDTGIGISEEKIPLIWDEFRQVSEGIGRSHEGTGLGLSITKKFVEKMNGIISVESELKKGTVFKLRFPVSVNQNIAPLVKHPQLPSISSQVVKKEVDFSGRMPKILYVEDDQISVFFVNRILNKFCELDDASDSDEALSMVKQKNYDLILMDINLGSGLNGLETTKLLRKIDKYKEIPIIAITAYAMQGDREEFISSGCTDYISKPFEANDLINLIKEVLSRVYESST